MKTKKKLSDVVPSGDEELERFWDQHEPEDFEGWEDSEVIFKRPPKKLIQLRLDPRDVRTFDRESKRSGIDRAQLVRSWVKEKLAVLEKGDASNPGPD